MTDKALSSLTQGSLDTGDYFYGAPGGNSRKIQAGTMPFSPSKSPAFTNLTQTGYHDLTEISEPSTPGANVGRLFARAVNSRTNLAVKIDTGHVIDLTRGVVNIRDFGAVGDGSTDDATAINAALTYAASNGFGIVFVPFGTHIVGSDINMQPNVSLVGAGHGSIIKQDDSADLDQVIDFNGNNAVHAALRNIQIHGNRDNNPGRLESGDNTKRIVWFAEVNHVTIDGCYIHSGPGYGISCTQQTNFNILNNLVENCENHVMFAVYTTGNFDADFRICNNYFGGLTLVRGLNSGVIQNNLVVGRLIGGTADPQTVDISGTTVTWDSGPDFSSVRKGDIIIASNGTVQEHVESVESSTSLTLNAAPGDDTGITSMFGEDDLLGVGACKRVVISGNVIRNGASFGISLAGQTLLDDIVCVNNIMQGQGKFGWALLGNAVGAANIVVANNIVFNSCIGGLAGVPANGGYSYYLNEDGAGNIDRITFTGNYAHDNAGNTETWLGLSSIDAGTAFIGGGNHQVGAASEGIDNAVSSVTLSAGWGNTASTSDVRSEGDSIILTVTCGGTGIGANPSVTVNTAATKTHQGHVASQNLRWQAKMVGGTGTLALCYNEDLSSLNAVFFRYSGTPVDGETYKFVIN